MRTWEEVTRDAARDALPVVMASAGPGMDEQSLAVCREVSARIIEAATIIGRKQVAYGCRNVAEIGGEGLVRRIREKLCRIERIVAGAPDGGESVHVEALDCANIALILCLVLDGAWPGAAWEGAQESEEDRLRARVALLEARLAARG